MDTEMAQIYTDFRGLHAMRAHAREDQQAALESVSRQFESLFIQMMLSSMRKASDFGGGLLDSQQSDFYRDMHDQQLSINLGERNGLGLADMMVRQLGGVVPGNEAGNEAGGKQLDDYQADPITRAQKLPEQKPAVKFSGDPAEFVQTLLPQAQAVAEKLGVAPEALLAQAALETGWGKHVMGSAGYRSSHNLFGIKADSRWQGDQVRVSTLEYRDGVALKTRAAFRAYDSFAESFADYADFVGNNPRYADAMAVSDDPQAYFQALQDAGYATDPAYAAKIARILDSEALQQVKAQAPTVHSKPATEPARGVEAI